MTSGSFSNVAIEQITVNREGRQRREISGIPELADSIKRLGLINPITVARDLSLVAGERRLAACKSLGHTHINIQYFDELDESTRRAIELEENVKRAALPWQDECKAVYEYHFLRKAENPDWSLVDTEKALGLEKSVVSDRIAVAKELLAGNERVAEAPKYSTARGIVERKNLRLEDKALAEFKAVAGVKSPLIEESPDSILNVNFLEWAPTYTGPKFNFIHCDFPYGIGADKFNQGAAPTHGGYDDSEDTYWSLLECLALNLNRIASPSCHIMFWFSMHFYTDTIKFFNSRTDFIIDPFPLVWTKSDNVGILPDPSRGPRRIYETALFGARGDRKVVRSKSNSYSCQTDRRFHMSVKPEPMLKNFMEMFVDESTIMLDPTCGSGSSLRAALSLSASHILGLEINKEFYEAANKELNKTRINKNAGK